MADNNYVQGEDEVEDKIVGERCDTILLAPELDTAVMAIFNSKDALDAPEFPYIDFINYIFKGEEDLEHIGNVLEKLKTKLKLLDQEIFNLLRSQADAGDAASSELIAIKNATGELFNKIKRIQQKAMESETLVQDITKDIKSLDNAKRNMSLSSTLIKRLQLIVSAVDQAKQMSSKRKYAETAQLLEVIQCIEVHFEGHRKIIQLSNLLDNISQFRTYLKKQIMMEFENFYNTGTLKVQSNLLIDACRTLEVLDSNAKTQLIDWYCDLQLSDYRELFKNPEVAGLDSVGRRYGWLKRLLKTFDEQHSSAFLPAWKMGDAFCYKFCEHTKRDMTDILVRSDNESMDVKAMLTALQLSTEFETAMAKRFSDSGVASSNDVIASSSDVQGKSRFLGIISSTFEPFLHHYVLSEEKVIVSMMEVYLAKPIISEEDAVLSSSADLFYYYRQSMNQCAKFSTKAPFLNLCGIFKKYLNAYADFLLSKLPKDDRKPMTSEDTRTACLIINTAEYCSTTIPQLEEKFKGKISAEFADKVNFNTEVDSFINVALNAVQRLISGIELAVDPSLAAMTKRPWGQVESVGDQSEYVSLIATSLTTHVTNMRKMLQGQRFFRAFCDRFAESFLGRFYASIMKCKPISEVGAEQMLLDTHSLRAILIQMTSIGEEAKFQPPAAYVKLVGRGVLKIEQLLKVVLRPIDPVAGIVETFMLLNPEFNPAAFQKILDIKGLKRVEMQHVMEGYYQRFPEESKNINRGNIIQTTPLGNKASIQPGQTSASTPAQKVFGTGFKMNFTLKRN